MGRNARRRAFTLVELTTVLIVIGLAAGIVLARLPYASTLRLQHEGTRLAARLSEARERAIVEGRPVRVDVADGLRDDVRLEMLDVGGTVTSPPVLELGSDGDALPVRAILADENGARLDVLLPAGFQHARVLSENAP
jgi:prepilin-type N-terminal cleavage/methylation domain-containing protein